MDASVWVPLASPDHVHHARTRQYWDFESAERAAFCRVTGLAFLRHLTNPRVMGHAVSNSQESWEEYERWLAHPAVIVLGEPRGLHEQFREFAANLTLGQASWTDAYLAAFAIAGGYRLVTVDSGFRRYSGLDLVHLEV